MDQLDLIQIQSATKKYWINSTWSKSKKKKLDQLDLIQIQFKKYWINSTWSKSSTKNIGSTRLDQNPKNKNWINLTWSKSRTKHIGSSRISGVDLFDPNPASRYIFRRPLPVIWKGCFFLRKFRYNLAPRYRSRV